jgi:O-antigen ligase
VAAAPTARNESLWPSDPLRWALFILVIMTISRLNGHFPFLIQLRPLLVLSVAALGFALMNPRLLSRLPWAKTWPARVCMALGFVACCSALFGISLGGAGRTIIEDYSKVLIVVFLVMATMGSARDLHMYIWAYVIACTIIVVDAQLGGQMQQASFDSSLARLSGFNSTYDANDVGVVLLVGLALSFYTYQMSGAFGKIVSLFTIIGIGTTLAKTGSRGAFVGLVAFGLAALLLISSVSIVKRVLFIAAVGIALAVASPEGYWEQMKTILSPKEDYNWTAETGRRELTKRGLKYLAAYPVFGLGIGNFPMAEATLAERAKNWQPGDPGIPWVAPHNSFLQVATEMGGVGLLLWSTLVLGTAWSLVRRRKRLPNGWRQGSFTVRVVGNAMQYVPVAVVGFAVSGAFVSFAYLDPAYLLAAFGVGVILFTAPQPVPGVTPGASPAAAGPRRRRR